MELLLDTNILLRVASGDLSNEALSYVSNPKNTMYFSMVSVWEVAMGLGDKVVNPRWFYDNLIERGFKKIDIITENILLADSLPPIHSDVFDRMLIIQMSATDDLYILTTDEIMPKYSSRIIQVSKKHGEPEVRKKVAKMARQ